MIEREIVIVGAGPAGMSAALALVQAGALPTVLDENRRSGGQIFRQPPPHAPESPLAKDSTAAHGSELCERFEAERGIEVLTGTRVWNVFADRQLAISRAGEPRLAGDPEGGWQILQPRHLLLATGAYEYAAPFPGWTLPGVMTPGGAQSLVKTWNVRPGRTAVVAGTGPFLLVVAQQLNAAGVEVRAVVEMARRTEFARRSLGLLSDPGLLLEGSNYLRKLRAAGIPVRWGHVVYAANANSGVLGSVAVAPCDRDGKPDRTRGETIECETLAVGYGFVPRIELAQLAGCELRFRCELGGWIPSVDDDCRSNVENVYVAGDGGGVSGSLVAELEGRLAGLAIARTLGLLSEADYASNRRPVHAKLAHLRAFRAALDAVYRVRPGLVGLADPDTLACRCEELSCAELDNAVGFGGSDYRTLKVMTRIGMGPCQGRMCWPAMARRIAQHSARSPEDIGPMRFRPPICPVTVGDLTRQLALKPDPAGMVGEKVHEYSDPNG